MFHETSLAHISNSGPTGSVNDCVIAGSGTIGASSTWSSEEQTSGHVRLGRASGTGSSCGLGTLVGNSATKTLGYGSTVSYSTTTNVSSTWSARFYNPNFYDGHCAAF